jgi:hypothetical protein
VRGRHDGVTIALPRSTFAEIPMTRAAPHLLSACLVFLSALSMQALAQNPPAGTDASPSDGKAPPPRLSQPSPEQMQKSVGAAMESMVPMMGRMAEVGMAAQLKIAAEPETAERMAAFKKNLYDQLQKKGFTPSQALQITIATPLPSAGIGK